MLNIAERAESGVTVFALDGRIDVFGAADLDRALQAAFSTGKRNLVLDIAGVDHISSAGVRALADAVARNRQADGDLKLVGSNRRVLRILHIIGLERLFSSYVTLDAALADC